MHIGFVILCRFNSSRLPGKILKEINGKTVLSHVYDQLVSFIDPSQILVATSDQKSDNPIQEYCNSNQINCYRGSLENVSLRFLNVARANDFDFVFRINGDNLFINEKLIKSMKALAETDQYDFISNVPGRTWGYGMSLECLRTSFYEEVFQTFETPDQLEHVTIALYNDESLGRRKYILNESLTGLKNKRLALDTLDDFKKLTLLQQKVELMTTTGLDKMTALSNILSETEI